ncbi:MAG: aminotransferase class I and II [Flavobacteriia bacterium]|nr:aminotransferase class I and II [Flavobacteriia bacterium]OJX37040.1 MAG: aminotransferase class I and II [Flavobacteriia bacterium 40-80]
MSLIAPLRTVTVMRYITPLREGGSLPALAEADDEFKYVLKFRGAGHGVKALISEFISGQIAKYLGLPIPELVFAELDEGFGKTEADEEIQDLLLFSKGLNLGLHYLQGALTFEAAVNTCESYLASKIVWFDAFITNIDRTFRNTNLLIWHKEIWLIDNGASFYFHHSWDNWEQAAKSTFPYVKDHVLLPFASELDRVDEEFSKVLTKEALSEIVTQIPADWLQWEGSVLTPEEIRKVYEQFLHIRLDNSRLFTEFAKNAR